MRPDTTVDVKVLAWQQGRERQDQARQVPGFERRDRESSSRGAPEDQSGTELEQLDLKLAPVKGGEGVSITDVDPEFGCCRKRA